MPAGRLSAFGLAPSLTLVCFRPIINDHACLQKLVTTTFLDQQIYRRSISSGVLLHSKSARPYIRLLYLLPTCLNMFIIDWCKLPACSQEALMPAALSPLGKLTPIVSSASLGRPRFSRPAQQACQTLVPWSRQRWQDHLATHVEGTQTSLDGNRPGGRMMRAERDEPYDCVVTVSNYQR